MPSFSHITFPFPPTKHILRIIYTHIHTHIVYMILLSLLYYTIQFYLVLGLAATAALLHPNELCLLPLLAEPPFLLVLGESGHCPFEIAISLKFWIFSRVSMIAGILGLSFGFKLTHCWANMPISLAPLIEYWPPNLGSIIHPILRLLVK